jgi:hypothetical protein
VGARAGHSSALPAAASAGAQPTPRVAVASRSGHRERHRDTAGQHSRRHRTTTPRIGRNRGSCLPSPYKTRLARNKRPASRGRQVCRTSPSLSASPPRSTAALRGNQQSGPRGCVGTDSDPDALAAKPNSTTNGRPSALQIVRSASLPEAVDRFRFRFDSLHRSLAAVPSRRTGYGSCSMILRSSSRR